MSRRGILGGAAALAAATLAACGSSNDVQDACIAAAEQVDGVKSCDLGFVSGATFEKAMRGAITTDADSRSAAVDVFGRAMEAIAGTAVTEGDAESERNRVVGAVTALTAEGEELTVWDLRPDLQSSKGRLDAVLVSDFLEQ